MSKTKQNKRQQASRLPRRMLLVVLGVAALAASAVGFDWWRTLPPGLTATYVGRQTCATCHQQQYELWSGSDHDLAMDLATPEFVLGNFDNTQLEHHGVTSRMSRRGDQFFVETQGPDGQITEFAVKYVLGYRPLQQYLAELDRGQIQVLPVTWDTQKKEWFYASPDAPFGPADPLHWTGSAQNWNHMCADCHTTNFAKNYDLPSDSYHSTWSEGDVSCEACHGPGSIHVELANSRSLFWDRLYGYGLARLKGKDSTPQLEACAPCHAHRQHISPEFKAGDRFYDHFNLSQLEDHLYFDDGQIDEEVYVFGSFTQSLMYRKGVRCTDCHDPHSTRVKFEGNKLCTQCHLAAKYDGPAHHHHKVDSAGAKCVECHMPERTYMVVDPRRDHSLRIPRPDLTVKIGTPNACNSCHTKPDETPQWAAAKVVEWFGPQRRDDPHYGEVFHAGRQGDPAARDLLADLAQSRDVGPIVRATALSILASHYPLQIDDETIVRALKHRDAPVRASAVAALQGRPLTSQRDAEELRRLLGPMLSDRTRLVRVEAARVATSFPQEIFAPEERAALERAIDEYREGLMVNADQSGTQMSLGLLAANLGDVSEAIQRYRDAIRLDPALAGPRSNLAQLLGQLGREDEAQQLRREELPLLARDAELLPDNALLQYRVGLLHYLLGDEEQAEQALSEAARLEPQSGDFQMALTLLYEKQQRWPQAQAAADKLVAIQPDNAMYRQIRDNILRAASL